MNESSVTRNLMIHLRAQIGWVVDKLSDHFTIGVPDIQVTCCGNTVWFEVKFIKKDRKEIMAPRNYAVQMQRMIQRARAGRAYYLVFYSPSKMVEIWQPAALKDLIENNNVEQSPWTGCKWNEWNTLMEQIRELAA